ncbi:transforming growth factor beta-1-induced transcript 1 protein [Drosophila subobscura]|uniref:transforming growth factor beta-1-induced transcript 1 protein n=1 Tax=Drosophila subobscura TaxID=7241 RepID=UPI00155A373D|nr:transforming growth factor beta-1-induced transcript 1 protein [Drosophila subobscura]
MSHSPEPPVYCYKCKQIIEQRIITALGQTWHPGHFACKDCEQPITDATFNIQDNEPVCTDCFVKNYSGTCFGCKQPIMERTIKAMEQSWHEECFQCSGPCKKPLAGTSFYERDGQPYCRVDYEQLFAIRCAGCDQPITDNAIVALKAKWHRSCFKCKKCGAPITASTFAVEENQPMCKDCSG